MPLGILLITIMATVALDVSWAVAPLLPASLVGLVVLFSILLHGLTMTPIMRSLDHRRGVDTEAQQLPPPGLRGGS